MSEILDHRCVGDADRGRGGRGGGEKTLEFAGRVFDGVILHTYFNDHAMERSVAAVWRGAEQVGKDRDGVRIWSLQATIGDHIPDEFVQRFTGGLDARATTAELKPILLAYRAARPARFAKTPANAGRPIR